ncbi:ankyrin repeat domain-containing protein, partial [bacterium]|nr:ankyrin repeat domain-containing protein [bacterium]
MRRQGRAGWAVLAALAGISWAAALAEADKPTALALVPAAGDRAPARMVLERLEAAWLEQKEVVLVERQQLDRILTEHQFSGAAILDSQQRIRLGQFVPADLLVFLDSTPKLPKPATRVQVSESKTGIVLASGLFENDPLLRDPQPALDLVRGAIAKRAVPVADRHLLGYLEFRSEESGPMLEGFAAALGTLVVTDLARAPHVVVLEREHLQHLQTERELTKLDQDLRTSVRLLEAGLRRGATTNELVVTVVLRPLAGGAPLTEPVKVSAGDLFAARDLVSARLAALLKVKRVEAPAVDRATEAARYAAQAAWWSVWEDKDRALRGAQTAYALDPGQANRLLLARTLVFEPAEKGTMRTCLPRRLQQTTVGQAVRSTELLLDYYRIRTTAFDAGRTDNLELPFTGYIAASQFVDDGGASDAAEELRRLEELVFGVQLEFYRSHYEQAGARYWRAWAERMDWLAYLYPREPGRRLALIREAAEAFAKMPDLPGPYPTERLSTLLTAARASTAGAVFTTGMACITRRPLFADAAARDLWHELWQELVRQQDPFLRFAGHEGIACLLAQTKPQDPAFADYLAAKRAMRRILIEEIPYGHRTRRKPSGTYHFSKYSGYGVDRLLFDHLLAVPRGWDDWPAPARQETLDDLARLLRDLIQSGQPRRFAELDRVHPAWLQRFADNGRTEEALRLSEELLAALRPYIYPHTVQVGDVEALRDRFRNQLQGTPIPKPPPLETNGSGWDDYEIRPMALRLPLAEGGKFKRSTLFLMSAGNRLYALRPVQPDPARPETADLELTTHWLPHGGMIGRTVVPAGLSVGDRYQRNPNRWIASVYAATLGDDTIYVGTCAGLLRIPLGTDRWKLLTAQDGLPGTTVRALGWLAGKLYLGIGCEPYAGEGDDQAVFASYDPVTERFQIIASEKGVDRDNPWNGRKFFLDDIAPDPVQGWLWLKSRGQGIWRFTPATGKLDEVVGTNKWMMVPGSRYLGQLANDPTVEHAGITVILFRPRDQALINLPQLVRGWLTVQPSYAVVCDGDTVIAAARIRRHNADGTEYRDLLFLPQPIERPSPFLQWPNGEPFPGVRHLVETEAGFVGVAADGTGYLIQPKAKAAQYRRLELQAASGDERETQLLDAAEAGDVARLEALLAAGADVNAVNGGGWTGLHYAADRGRTEAVRVLLGRGADLRRGNGNGFTALALAAGADATEVMALLLARQKDPDLKGTEGMSPLEAAVDADTREAVALLLAHGADVNQPSSRANRNPVLMNAALAGHGEVVRILVEHQADLEGTDHNGNTALIAAAVRGHTNVVAYLLRRGAQRDAANRHGYTALMFAADRG